MTVSYPETSFHRLLLIWKGSIWKKMWKKFIVFLSLHYSLTFIFIFILNEEQKFQFIRVSKLFDHVTKRIPIEFILGFFVSAVFNRWWDQAQKLKYPDALMTLVQGNIRGNTEEAIYCRRTFARQFNLFFVMAFQDISLKIKRRFPTDEHLHSSGLMTEAEWQTFCHMNLHIEKEVIPYSWMINLVGWAKDKNYLTDEAQSQILAELSDIRDSYDDIRRYNWMDIPLIYTQVTAIAVYTYFAFCMIGRQTFDLDGQNQATGSSVDVSARKAMDKAAMIEMYFPILTLMEFIFHVGWLMVGETMMFTFGEDDDAFDMNYILDRNMHISFLMADALSCHLPDIVKDPFYGKAPRLPHTVGSICKRDPIPMSKHHWVTIAEKEAQLISHKTRKVLHSNATPAP